MSDTDSHKQLHFGDRPNMDTFIVDTPGDRLLHDRGATLVHGYLTTPELARGLEAANAELRDAMERAGVGPNGDPSNLPAWEKYMGACQDIEDARRGVSRYDTLNSDTLDIDTGWLAENLQVDEHERIVPGQVITAEQIAMSGAVNFLPKRQLY